MKGEGEMGEAAVKLDYADAVIEGWVQEGQAEELAPVTVIPPEEQTCASTWDVTLKVTTVFSMGTHQETPDLQTYEVTVSTDDEYDEDDEIISEGIEAAGKITVTLVDHMNMGERQDIFWQFDASDHVPEGVATLFEEDGYLIKEIEAVWEFSERLLVITDFWLDPSLRGKGVLQAAIKNLQSCLGGVPVICPGRGILEEEPELTEEVTEEERWSDEAREKRHRLRHEAFLKAHTYLRTLGFVPGPSPGILWLPREVLEGWAGEVD